MLVFSPWAFGTTQPWSIWTMNVAGYLLGVILVAKWLIRAAYGYKPPRWDYRAGETDSSGFAAGRAVVAGLVFFTVAILAYCLVAALNARSTYNAAQMEFIYRPHVPWLPHSYDRARTLQSLASYLALACFFWAVRDWLLGKTEAEIRTSRAPDRFTARPRCLPARLRRLLWVLSVNGALLGIESIAQRLSDTNKLLWLKGTRENPQAVAQFGPYAYRGNAAQYFNLVWPVTLAFWWTLRREVRYRLSASNFRHRAARPLLLAAVLVMAACPIITVSRGGALVAVGNMMMAATILVFAMRHGHALTRFGVVLFFAAAAATGLWFGWDKLGERLKDAGEGFRGREATFQIARRIAADFPVFGTGPGTFEPVFPLYRKSLDEYWPKQLHNDWLETRITFGWVGCGLIAPAFLLVIARWFAGGGIRTGGRFVSLLWLALGGCLLHARYDFPLQIYSILLVFLLVCAVLCAASRRTS
jgi:O-antigen ligase